MLCDFPQVVKMQAHFAVSRCTIVVGVFRVLNCQYDGADGKRNEANQCHHSDDAFCLIVFTLCYMDYQTVPSFFAKQSSQVP
jgi:anti-sigma factor ChrR (cupin superfamily)